MPENIKKNRDISKSPVQLDVVKMPKEYRMPAVREEEQKQGSSNAKEEEN